jgi:hypothetical protein
MLELDAQQDRRLANLDRHVEKLLTLRKRKRQLMNQEETLLREICCRAGQWVPSRRVRNLGPASSDIVQHVSGRPLGYPGSNYRKRPLSIGALG